MSILDRRSGTDGAHRGTGHGPSDGMLDGRVGLARRVIAVHDSHDAAERTIRKLADADFPVERAAIVGRDLTTVQRVTGLLSTPEVAARGALSGVVIGALTGWLLAVVDLITPTVAVAWLTINAAILGAVLGAVTGLLGYVFTRGRRSVATTSAITAAHYDVTVDAELADRAARLLADDGPGPDRRSGESDAASAATKPSR